MTLSVQAHIELTSLVAQSNSFASYSSSAFCFDAHAARAVSFAIGSIVSNTQALQIALQHSRDGVNWDSVITHSLAGTAAAYAFEPNTVQPKPLLPYGRACFGLTANGSKAEWKNISLDYLTDKK